jgi:hypothetical protein
MIIAIICVALLVRYALVCYLAPFRDCRRCDGLGRIRPRTGLRRAVRPCRRCRATGKRLRAGRHVLNYLSATRRAARTAEHTRTATPPTASTGPRR